MSSRSVSVRLVTRLVAAAAALGADPPALIEAAGLRVDDLADRDGALPHETLLRVWTHAEALTGDRAFGVHAAELARRSPDNVLAYAFQHSASLRDAIGRMSRYVALAHRSVALSLVESGGSARLRFHFPGNLGRTRHGVEFALALFCIAGRQYVPAFAATRVSLTHAAPADDAEHRRVFGAPVAFGQARDEVVFDPALLARPMRDVDPSLCASLERHLDELLRNTSLPTFIGRVRRAVGDDLRGGTPDVETVAARMHMSARSLQRRLKQDGASFQKVVNDLRRDLATTYLTEPDVSVAEVAFLLGFSEVSNFHRAYKRWTGRTPAASRREPA